MRHNPRSDYAVMALWNATPVPVRIDMLRRSLSGVDYGSLRLLVRMPYKKKYTKKEIKDGIPGHLIEAWISSVSKQTWRAIDDVRVPGYVLDALRREFDETIPLPVEPMPSPVIHHEEDLPTQEELEEFGVTCPRGHRFVPEVELDMAEIVRISCPKCGENFDPFEYDREIDDDDA